MQNKMGQKVLFYKAK